MPIRRVLPVADFAAEPVPELAQAAPQPLRPRVRPVTSLPRNGLPELPLYVYRGTGADQLAGQYGDADLDGSDAR